MRAACPCLRATPLRSPGAPTGRSSATHPREPSAFRQCWLSPITWTSDPSLVSSGGAIPPASVIVTSWTGSPEPPTRGTSGRKHAGQRLAPASVGQPHHRRSEQRNTPSGYRRQDTEMTRRTVVPVRRTWWSNRPPPPALKRRHSTSVDRQSARSMPHHGRAVRCSSRDERILRSLLSHLRRRSALDRATGDSSSVRHTAPRLWPTHRPVVRGDASKGEAATGEGALGSHRGANDSQRSEWAESTPGCALTLAWHAPGGPGCGPIRRRCRHRRHHGRRRTADGHRDGTGRDPRA